jgi:predicted PurR-regulated permease PerM
MVPYLGALLTLLVIGVISLITYNVSKAVVVLIVLLVISQTFDYVIAPRILGHHVGMHPLLSLFAMVSAGTLYGVAGVILAVPVAASILVVLRHLYPHLLVALSEGTNPEGELAIESMTVPSASTEEA